jgi:hypothetical protein
MSIDQITAEALRLSPQQRAMLAESLWESLSDPFETFEPDEPSIIQLAAERDRQIESGEVQAISHEELMSRRSGSEDGAQRCRCGFRGSQ